MSAHVILEACRVEMACIVAGLSHGDKTVHNSMAWHYIDFRDRMRDSNTPRSECYFRSLIF